MSETASERGARIIAILEKAGKTAGLEVHLEYPVVGGRIDVAWLWRGPASFPSVLPVVGFEVESSWRTRKHIKGDLLNLLDLQPALGVIVLLGDEADVESTRKFARQMVDRRPIRVEIWSEDDVLRLSRGEPGEVRALLTESASEDEAGVGNAEARPLSHTGKYRRFAHWLAAEPGDRLEMTFSQIEEILGFPLPPSSRKHPAHWSSYDGSAVARAIHDAGWRARNVDLNHETVAFDRGR